MAYYWICGTQHWPLVLKVTTEYLLSPQPNPINLLSNPHLINKVTCNNSIYILISKICIHTDWTHTASHVCFSSFDWIWLPVQECKSPHEQHNWSSSMVQQNGCNHEPSEHRTRVCIPLEFVIKFHSVITPKGEEIKMLCCPHPTKAQPNGNIVKELVFKNKNTWGTYKINFIFLLQLYMCICVSRQPRWEERKRTCMPILAFPGRC